MISKRNLLQVMISFAALLTVAVIDSAQTITLEQLMSSPFPSELIASKRGDKIAWVFYSQGKRNIFVAEAPAFASRQLTHHDVEDGQDVTEIVFSPNGNTIEQTLGCAAIPGLDWHLDIQHVAAQVRRLRELTPTENVVLAVVEAEGLAWPTWRAKHTDHAARIRALVESLKADTCGAVMVRGA